MDPINQIFRIFYISSIIIVLGITFLLTLPTSQNEDVAHFVINEIIEVCSKDSTLVSQEDHLLCIEEKMVSAMQRKENQLEEEREVFNIAIISSNNELIEYYSTKELRLNQQKNRINDCNFDVACQGYYYNVGGDYVTVLIV